MKQIIVFFTLFVLYASLFADESNFEAAEDQQAADLLPTELLKGEHHQVASTVRSDGYLNYYTIRSDYGEFSAISTAMLKTRVGEINALAELDDLSQTAVFINAAADAGVGQLKSIKQFAVHPVETVVGIPSGVGRLFKRYSRQAGDAVDATKEFVAGDDVEAAEGEVGESESTSDETKSLTESFFGISGAERAWAQKLGTDPYSTNEVLKAAIKDVAWAERLGRFGMGFLGVPEIPGADIIGEVNDAVWSKDPYELQDLNRSRLIETGADEDLIEAYLENPNLSPSQQTLLTAAIAEIDGASGRDGILVQALIPESEAEANFLIKSVMMLAWYHISQNPVIEITTQSAIPTGITADGTAVMLFAVDHVYWTETMAKVAGIRSLQNPDADREIWLLGTASQRAREELMNLGFEVHEGVASMIRTPAG